jgi:hypothetical protein
METADEVGQAKPEPDNATSFRACCPNIFLCGAATSFRTNVRNLPKKRRRSRLPRFQRTQNVAKHHLGNKPFNWWFFTFYFFLVPYDLCSLALFCLMHLYLFVFSVAKKSSWLFLLKIAVIKFVYFVPSSLSGKKIRVTPRLLFVCIISIFSVFSVATFFYLFKF